MKSATQNLLYTVAILALLAGCSNPTEGKPEATVSEAIEPEPEVVEVEPAPTETGAEMAEPASLPDERAYVLTDGTYIGFVGSKRLGQHFGQFPVFDGTVVMTGDDVTTAKIKVSFDTTQLQTDDSRLTSVLKNENFFAVEEHPKATFISTKITPGEEGHSVSGNLTIRGITKGITFPVSIDVRDDTVTAEAEFTIDRNAWDIGKGYTGETIIRDEVLISLDVIAEGA